MCFGGKPKLNKPKMEPITQTPVTPIENQTPTIEDGATQAAATSKKKRSTNPGLSLFQIQLLPGAATSTEDPGVNTDGVV